MNSSIPDINGKPVKVGSKVRLLSIPDWLIEEVPEDEAIRLKAMIGKIFIVYEIDKYAGVWVEKIFDGPENGQFSTHSVSLDSDEIELIEEKI